MRDKGAMRVVISGLDDEEYLLMIYNELAAGREVEVIASNDNICRLVDIVARLVDSMGVNVVRGGDVGIRKSGSGRRIYLKVLLSPSSDS